MNNYERYVVPVVKAEQERRRLEGELMDACERFAQSVTDERLSESDELLFHEFLMAECE